MALGAMQQVPKKSINCGTSCYSTSDTIDGTAHEIEGLLCISSMLSRNCVDEKGLCIRLETGSLSPASCLIDSDHI